VVPRLGLAPGATVLELGCGPGTYVRYLVGFGHRVVGVDYSLSTLSRAVEADAGAGGRYLAADGYQLPFAAAAFDLVICIGVLQAVAGPERLLDEMARVLRPGGVVLVETLNARGLPAAARRARELAAGRPRKLRTYSPGVVRHWLARRDIARVQRWSVYVPPRRSTLARLLDVPAVLPVLERVPGGAILLAQAFWTMGRKRAGATAPSVAGAPSIGGRA
jgi:SAM-dependent methyltransferase